MNTQIENLFPIKQPSLEKIQFSGINELFSQFPQLSETGTEEQYSEYLKTIFPESTVTDIVFHATDKQFESFNKKYIGTSTDKGSYGKGFYFGNKKRNFGENVMNVLIHLKNPIMTDPVKFYEEKNGKPNFNSIEAYENYDGNYIEPTPEILTQFLINKGFDGVAFQREENSDTEYVAFEPEQIHILGSASDIKKFKEFVSSK